MGGTHRQSGGGGVVRSLAPGCGVRLSFTAAESGRPVGARLRPLGGETVERPGAMILGDVPGRQRFLVSLRRPAVDHRNKGRKCRWTTE